MNGGWWVLLGVGAAGGLGLVRDLIVENRRTFLHWRKEREDELRAARVACLMILDELDTQALNYRQLAQLKRTPARPVTQTPDYLSSKEWEAHKHDLARLTVIPDETWTGLMHAYHNAQQLRARVELDGPNVDLPAHRIPTLVEHAEAADELVSILRDVAENIRAKFVPHPRRWAKIRRRLRT